MKIIKSTTHPDIKNLKNPTYLKRIAARAIILKEDSILLLYTKRYNDYSLPGGGVDEGEDIIKGLKRELKEETGAGGIRNIKPFCIYEEYRPWYKPEFDAVHMLSHCFTCDIDEVLGETNYETYEITNGMKPIWIKIDKAIKHNEGVILKSDKKGLSIERETFLFKKIQKDLIKA